MGGGTLSFFELLSITYENNIELYILLVMDRVFLVMDRVFYDPKKYVEHVDDFYLYVKGLIIGSISQFKLESSGFILEAILLNILIVQKLN